MVFESTCRLIGTKTGKDSKGKEWYLFKFLDNEDKHINVFGDKKAYEMAKIGESYICGFTLYYDLKREKYIVNGKVVSKYEC